MNDKPFITLPNATGVELVPLEKIIYISSNGKKCNFIIEKNKRKTVSTQIGEIEEILKEAAFVRCHQQYIVNIFKISKIFTGSKRLMMSNETELIISRTYRENFREKVAEYCYKITNNL